MGRTGTLLGMAILMYVEVMFFISLNSVRTLSMDVQCVNYIPLLIQVPIILKLSGVISQEIVQILPCLFNLLKTTSELLTLFKAWIYRDKHNNKWS